MPKPKEIKLPMIEQRLIAFLIIALLISARFNLAWLWPKAEPYIVALGEGL